MSEQKWSEIDDQERLRIVTENARVGFTVITPDHHYAYANVTYGEILGFASADIVGQHMRDVLSDIYVEQIAPRLARAFNGQRVEYEARRAAPDGGRYYLVRYEPAKESEGNVYVVGVVTDITEHKRTQLESDQLAAIVESSDDAIIGEDLDSVVTIWNAGAEKLFGFAAAEMIGSSIRPFIPPDRYDEDDRIKQLICSGQSLNHFETQSQRKDGSLVDVSVTASPIRSRDGTIIGISKIARDITERIRAEKELLFHRTMLETEHDLTPDGILAVDKDNHVLSYNRRFSEMWGVPVDLLAVGADEAVLTSVREKVVDPDGFVERVRDLYRLHDAVAQDEVALNDGRIFDRYTAPMHDAAGRYYGRIWYFRDITEQHSSTEALRIAEERMRFALESAGVGIWDLDGATGELRWSELLESQYGLQPATFEGTSDAFLALVHPEDRERLTRTIEQAMHEGASFREQHRAVWPDGTVRYLTGAGRFVLDEQGTLIRGVGINLDVTDQRNLEQQYNQAQKMEAIGQLAGGIAHDFNNLLTAILGYCQLLLDERNPEDPDWADISEIKKAGDRAAALTGQLLAFSRKQIITPTQLDLNEVIGDMQDMLGRLIAENIEVVVDLEQGLWPVEADRGQIEQVIMNLAVNARDAMPRGGKLVIETSNVELDKQYARDHFDVAPGSYVLLTLRDTGTGFPQSVKARLFEPFFTTKEQGTGLGLATVHGIVLRAGGNIEVFSEQGVGTSFSVYLPRMGELPQPRQTSTIHQERGNESVLVVEDGDALRTLAKRQLERHGYKVFTASDAVEALQVCELHSEIELVLTDVVMPGASGPELVKQLLELRPDLKVIYMSGFTEDTIAQQGILRPGIAFLQKPFTSVSLGMKLREVLDSQAGSEQVRAPPQ